VSLPTRPLGTSGLEITTVGFGAWAVGGGGWQFGWGPQDDEQSIAAIRYAVESGVNWIDTAAAYGLGHSEEVVARALDGVAEPDRPFVFTKAGTVWDPADPSSRVRREINPASVRREVEASLRRLRTERIDLYQVHWPPSDGTPVAEYWQAMADLKAEGKVRAIGLSNHRLAHLEEAEKVAHVDSLQPPFSAVDRRFTGEIRWSADHGTGVIVYSPMQSGLLTGAFSRERAENLPDNDWRRSHPDFTTRLDANLAVAGALRPVAGRHGVPVPSVAVAWALAWPGVTGAIVGARGPGQVDGWLPAASLRLTDADLGEIAEAITRAGAGEGPARP
jgi:aryl-alcohol dehydrogenase-like predicted oxidoreductase